MALARAPTAPATTRPNETLLHAFEWHTPSTPPPSPVDRTAPGAHHGESHYARLTRLLPALARLGFSALLLPPGCKANNPHGNGYDCYDLWDLGEFEQKGRRSTRWGSREQLDRLIHAAKSSAVGLVWDAVLNHKTAGDATEACWAVEVDGNDRRCEICSPKQIEAWLQYDFPGRAGREGMKYSGMRWRAAHFNGTDWDQRAQKRAIYKIIDDAATWPKPLDGGHALLGDDSGHPAMRANLQRRSTTQAPVRRSGKDWATDVGQKFGNYDYLMFSNIYHSHPEVREDLLCWGRWMMQDIQLDGFRLDAVQHFSSNFTRQWIAAVQAARQQRRAEKPAWLIGEYFAGEVSLITEWLDAVTPAQAPSPVMAFDVPLLYSFSRVSEDVRTRSSNADLRTFLPGPGHDPDQRALVALRPQQAVTFVTSHDTQIGQTCHTPIDSSLKALFYAFILLRCEGTPCVFWGDLYGTHGPHAEGPACRMTVPTMTTTMRERRFLRAGKSVVEMRVTASVLPSLVLARRLFAYGAQTDYLDAMSCIGWTRAGTHDRPGCAVVMSIDAPSIQRAVKRMRVGRPGDRWVDIMRDGPARPEVVIDRKGFGAFPCAGCTVAVFVRDDVTGLESFPVRWDVDVYR